MVDLARWVRETFRADDFVVLKRAPPRASNPYTASCQPDECALRLLSQWILRERNKRWCLRS